MCKSSITQEIKQAQNIQKASETKHKDIETPEETAHKMQWEAEGPP